MLARLGRLGPLSINELAAQLATDRITLGRALRPLSRDGLLTIGSGRDGRTQGLHMTEPGRERSARATALWREAQREFGAAYGTGETAALRRTLGRVVEAVGIVPDGAGGIFGAAP